jgi:hypothetical protein
MESQSVNTLLTWLKSAPRTFGWGAILAYDRSKTNVMLEQEYIDRFVEGGNYLPPFTEHIPTGVGQGEFIYDYTVAMPVLSFENANIKSSIAKLTFMVFGGSQLSYSRPLGSQRREVTKIVSVDALDHQTLEMEIELRVVKGTVSDIGEVALNLDNATHWLSSMASTDTERQKIGEFFEGLFKSLEEKFKVFVLNRITHQKNQFIVPESFAIRTHPKPIPGGKKRTDPGVSAEDSRQGEVLLFVKMKDFPNGTFPAVDEDLMYLIPDGESPELSSSVLLGNEYLFTHVLREGCRLMSEQNPPEVEIKKDEKGFIDAITLKSGVSKTGDLGGVETTHIQYWWIPEMTVLIGDVGGSNPDNLLSIQFTDTREFVIVWQGRCVPIPATIKAKGLGEEKTETMMANWQIECPCTFELKPRTPGSPIKELSLVPAADRKFFYSIAPGAFAAYVEIIKYFDEIVGYMEQRLANLLDECLQRFFSASAIIDTFILDSLLFHSAQSVDLDQAHLPGDLAAFGRIAPLKTAFMVSPLHPIVGIGEQLQFETVPPTADVSWRVENAPGGSGPIGVIDAKTGRYTAPGPDSISGLYAQVRVIAETKDLYTSSALAMVVVNEITVNPLIQTCSSQGDQREVSAGSLKSAALEWSISNPASGATVMPSTDPKGDHTYRSGPSDPALTFSVDEIIVKHDTASASSYVLVVHKPPVLNITATEIAAPGQPSRIQLKALSSGGIEIPSPTWSLQLGGGTLNQDGLYTPSAVSHLPFAVITVLKASSDPWNPPAEGYIILPIPLVEIPEVLSAINGVDPETERPRPLLPTALPQAVPQPGPAVSSHSLAQLLEQMKDTPVTLGWGAVLAFGRTQINRLLEQQFVAGFSSVGFLQPFSLSVELATGAETATLESIVLGAPALSFESANMTDSRARMRMKILSGRYTHFRQELGATKPYLVTHFQITEGMGFYVETELELGLGHGEIDRHGRIRLDLSGDGGRPYTCNLSPLEIAQKKIGEAIQRHLENQSDYKRVFELGRVDLSFYNPLSPVSFFIRTQPAPVADGQQEPDGDGAVLVFLKLNASQGNGQLPGIDSGFPYLIPDDQLDGTPLYSASIVIAEELKDFASDIEIDVLKNLFFTDENVFEKAPDGEHHPHDVLVLGNIKPAPTRVVVSPLVINTVVGGSPLQFTARHPDGSAVPALQWQASCLSHPSSAGTIEQNGLYTPVALSDANDVFVPTVLTAHSGVLGQQVSSALVLATFEMMGIAPRVCTCTVNGDPVVLVASTLNEGPITWRLGGQPDSGTLVQIDDFHALYTPPTVAADGPVLQEIIAEDGFGESVRASIIVLSQRQTLVVDPPYVSELPADGKVQLSTDYSNQSLRWSVQGEGSVDEDGMFTDAGTGSSSVSLVTCDYVDFGTVMGSGYSVIYRSASSALPDLPRWKSLDLFTIKASRPTADGRGQCYANGLQQIAVEIEIGTASVAVDGQNVYIPVSDLELSTLKLIDKNNIELPFIDPDQEGIEFGSDVVRAVHHRSNRFSEYSATGVRRKPQRITPMLRADGRRFKRLYIHLATEETFDIRAMFQADSGAFFYSHEVRSEPFELTVQGIKPPSPVTAHYMFKRERALNGDGRDYWGPDGNYAEPDEFGCWLDSIDYWRLSYEKLGMYPVLFSTLRAEGNTSTMQWESEQEDEVFFSYTGFAFYPARYGSTDLPPKKMTFDPYLRAFAKHKENYPLNVELMDDHPPSPGQLIVSVNRVDDMSFWDDRMAAGEPNKQFRAWLDKQMVFVLLDEEGNRHRLVIGFPGINEDDSRNTLNILPM